MLAYGGNVISGTMLLSAVCAECGLALGKVCDMAVRGDLQLAATASGWSRPMQLTDWRPLLAILQEVGAEGLPRLTGSALHIGGDTRKKVYGTPRKPTAVRPRSPSPAKPPIQPGPRPDGSGGTMAAFWIAAVSIRLLSLLLAQ